MHLRYVILIRGARIVVLTSWRVFLVELISRPVLSPVRLTSPSLGRRRHFLKEMYNMMLRPALLPCS